MARYFFHVRSADDDVSLDTEGQELPNLEAARREAENSNREMIGESLLHGGSLNHRQIEIANEKGEVLAVVKSKDIWPKEDQPRVFKEDVTRSAPTARTRKISAKSGAR